MTDEPNPQVPVNPPANVLETSQLSTTPAAPPSELETTSPLPALGTTPEPVALETQSEPMALETMPEPMALETTPELASLETALEPAALEAITPEEENPQASVEKETGVPPAPQKRRSGTSPASSTGRKRKAAKVTSAPPGATDISSSGTPSATEATSETVVSSSPPEGNKKWYVIKVASGREESIKTAIERKIKIEGLEQYFGQIVIPYEELVLKKTVKVKDKKTGEMVTQEKKTVKKQKKFPGYLFAELEINDRILYLFRETSGVGDFVGARGVRREPTPMTEREVQQILTGVVLPGDRKKLGPRQIVKLDFEKGDKVRIREGAFANMEGEVKAITEAKEEGDTPKVTVQVTVFGRPVDVTLDYWQVDKA